MVSTAQEVTHFTHEIAGAWKLRFRSLKEDVFNTRGSKSPFVPTID